MKGETAMAKNNKPKDQKPNMELGAKDFQGNKTNFRKSGSNSKGKNGYYAGSPKNRRENRPTNARNNDEWTRPTTKTSEAKDFADYVNNPEWYAPTMDILRDASNFNWGYPKGVPVKLETYNPNYGGKESSKLFIPGLETLYVRPSVGHVSSAADPLNQAGWNLYVQVRKTRSGQPQYDQPDLMLYIMGAADIYSYINYVQRAYAIATSYSVQNRYIPRLLLMAQGINPNVGAKQLADFRAAFNVFINKARGIVAPRGLHIFERRAFTFTGVYKQGDSVKDPMYMLVPESFYQFSVSSTEGGQLSLVKAPGFFQPDGCSEIEVGLNDGSSYKNKLSADNMIDWDDLLDFGYSLLTPFIENTDMMLIAADLLNAYSNLHTLDDMPESYPLQLSANLEMLEQLQNAVITRTAVMSPLSQTNDTVKKLQYLTSNISGGDIVQSADKGYLISNSYLMNHDTISTYYSTASNLTAYLTEKRLIKSIRTNPTPEDAMENTRLCVTSLEGNGNVGIGTKLGYGYLLETGSDYITGGFLWNTVTADLSPGGVSVTNSADMVLELSDNSAPGPVTLQPIYYYGTALFGAVTANIRDARVGFALIDYLNTRSYFTFAPNCEIYCMGIINYEQGATDVNVNYYPGQFGPIDNYTIIDPEAMKNMHDIAMLGLLQIPTDTKNNTSR